jgi:hypothetical protein
MGQPAVVLLTQTAYCGCGALSSRQLSDALIVAPMAARNIYHDIVVRALQAEGWTIITIRYGSQDLFVDLAAEHATLGAERAGKRIAVEIQSFLGKSPVRDLEEAVGQYDIYRAVLRKTNPGRQLFMAVPTKVYETLLTPLFGQLVVKELELDVIVFDVAEKRSLQWINWNDTAES